MKIIEHVKSAVLMMSMMLAIFKKHGKVIEEMEILLSVWRHAC